MHTPISATVRWRIAGLAEQADCRQKQRQRGEEAEQSGDRPAAAQIAVHLRFSGSDRNRLFAVHLPHRVHEFRGRLRRRSRFSRPASSCDGSPASRERRTAATGASARWSQDIAIDAGHLEPLAPEIVKPDAPADRVEAGPEAAGGG